MRPHAAAAALAAVALSLLVRPGSGINNGLARTPPMTWSSWGSFGCGVSEQHIRDTADDFVRLGLVEAGYSILQIDDCWSNKTHRAADGSLMANRTKFPSGTLAPVAKYVESKGLQLGIYTDLGVHTCAGYPGSGGPKNPDGSYGHYCQDAQTFADWGIHYIKQDFCGPRPGNCGTSDDAGGKACYTIMSECIAKTKKPIIFGLCSWGSDQPWTYGPAIANLWRTTADQQPLWESIMRSVDNQLVALSSAGPGGWNDMDELFMVGSGKENGRDHGSCLALSFVERQSMFNFWTMFAAPLAIGDDVGKLLGNSSSAVEARGLYTNKEVIAIDQDTLGRPAVKVLDSSPGGLQWVQVWARPLANGDVAALMFNRGSWGGCVACSESPQGCACQGLQFDQIGAALNDTRFSATAKVSVRFVWNHTTAPGVYANNKFPADDINGAAARLAPHQSLLVRLRIVNGSEPATDW